jgi:hypothetical protein
MCILGGLWKFQVRESQKRWGPQIANPQSVTFTEGPQM